MAFGFPGKILCRYGVCPRKRHQVGGFHNFGKGVLRVGDVSGKLNNANDIANFVGYRRIRGVKPYSLAQFVLPSYRFEDSIDVVKRVQELLLKPPSVIN